MNNKNKWSVPTDILNDGQNDGHVSLKQMIESLPRGSKQSFAYGVDENGKTVVGNFKRISHMQVVGEREYEKEMFIDTLLTTLIMRNSPEDLKIVLINNKKSVPESLKKYNNLPHLCFPIATTTPRRDFVFKSLLEEMNSRYELFEKYGVITLDKYNKNAKANKVSKLPMVIVIMNDYRQYAASNMLDTYHCLLYLAQKGRAAGIHMIICANRRGTYFIGPTLTANTPTQVKFDDKGGYKMFVKSPDIKRVRPIVLTCGYVSSEEVKEIITYNK